MSYYDSKPIEDEQPAPKPPPLPDRLNGVSLQWLIAAVAVAGLLLPPSGGWKTLPIPVPPFVEPVIDAAKTEGSWVVVIEETEDRTPSQAKLMRDTPWWDSLEARGLKWRHYDKDAEDAKPFLLMANEVGLPAVLIIGGKGELLQKVLAKKPLPASTEELNKLIVEATGR